MYKEIIYITLVILLFKCGNKKYENSQTTLYNKINISNSILNKDTNYFKNVNMKFDTDTSNIYYYNEILTNIGLSNLFFYKKSDYKFRLFLENEIVNRSKTKAFLFNFEKKENQIFSNLYILGKSIQSYINSGKFNDSIFKSKGFNSPNFSLGNNLYKGSPIFDTIVSIKTIDFNLDSVNYFLNLLDNFFYSNNNNKLLDFSDYFIEMNKNGEYKLHMTREIKLENYKEIIEICNFLKRINGLRPKDIKIYSWGL